MELSELQPPRRVKFGAGTVVYAARAGTAVIYVKGPDQLRRIELKDALHVPEATKNLVSLSKAASHGYRGELGADEIRMHRDGYTLFSAKNVRGLFVVPVEAGEQDHSAELSVRGRRRGRQHTERVARGAWPCRPRTYQATRRGRNGDRNQA